MPRSNSSRGVAEGGKVVREAVGACAGAVAAPDGRGLIHTIRDVGAVSRALTRLGPGDVTDHDAEISDHKPRADGDVGCICLIGSEGKARFRTFLARLMQPFHGM